MVFKTVRIQDAKIYTEKNLVCLAYTPSAVYAFFLLRSCVIMHEDNQFY